MASWRETMMSGKIFAALTTPVGRTRPGEWWESVEINHGVLRIVDRDKRHFEIIVREAVPVPPPGEDEPYHRVGWTPSEALPPEPSG